MTNDIFYVCAMTPDDCSGGIMSCFLDERKHLQVKTHMPFCGCSYLGYSIDRKVLYATCIIDGEGGAAAFKILPDGGLELLNKLPGNGRSSCYITAAPGGKYLYTANYSSASISEFRLNEDGSLSELVRTIHFEGRGVHERQDSAHPHFVKFTPDGRRLMVVDLGLDAVKQFEFDPECGLIDVESPHCFTITPPGSGPRHLIFNRQCDQAYVINEVGNTVSVLDYDGKNFTFRQQLSTLPADFDGYSKAAAIRFSADERFLLASNRGFDSIAVYRVLDDGALMLQDIVPSNGVSPRDINFLPDNRHLAAANEFSDNLVLFDFDPESGKLTCCNNELKMPRPLAVYW